MGTQKALFPGHPLTPPRAVDAVMPEDFLPSGPMQRQPGQRGNVLLLCLHSSRPRSHCHTEHRALE